MWLAVLASHGSWAAPVAGVSITGIMVYSTDDFGNPSGVNTVELGRIDAQLWRTLVRPGEEWHGLGITQGLQPRSIESPFLNFPNFTVDLPLDEGENYFTLIGEPGPITATDEYQRFSVNLYFDGDENNPGITVLFPRFADPDGTTVTESRANEGEVYSLTLEKVDSRPRGYYDDGFYRVSVLRASFLPPERINLSVDRMMPREPAASGTSDWVGSLVVMVEPSEAFGPGGGAPVPVAGGGGGGGTRTGGGEAAPGAGGPGFVPGGPIGGPAVVGAPQRQFDDEEAGSADPEKFWHEGDKNEEDADGTPTPADLVNALQEWLAAAGTQTPGADATATAAAAAEGTPALTTPTPSAGTPTAVKTAVGTLTPGLTGTPSPVAPTPTPAMPGAEKAAPDGDAAT